MKSNPKPFAIIALIAIITYTFTTCETSNEDPDLAVTLNTVTANGSLSQTTTQLTLTFNKAINNLSAADITFDGIPNITKGTLTNTGQTYTLPISGFTTSGTLSVEVKKAGYTITGSPKTVSIYYNENSGNIEPPPLTGTVTISGSAQVGQTLTADTTDLDGEGEITYQWKRGETIIGTNSSTYTLQSSDEGATITVTVTRSGYTGNKTSEPVTIITLPAATTVNYGDFKVASIDHSGISYINNILIIAEDGTYTISMKDGVTSTNTDSISIINNAVANITISDVSINRSSTPNACAFNMTGATVNLTLIGENILKSGERRAGLEAPAGSTLYITEVSTGSLNVTGGSTGGSGIGGSNFSSGDSRIGGNINIFGGTIIAAGSISGTGGAGIGGGGGTFSSGGTINISGGTVTATGGGFNSSGAAGIGGGGMGSGGNINISGGTVTAIGVMGGAGIGGSGGIISITGGTITADIANSPGWGTNPTQDTGTGTGIGPGTSGTGGTLNTIGGNAVIFAFSILLELPTGANLGPAIVFNGPNGIMYGNVTLERNLDIPSNRILIIQSDQTLNIQSGYAINNNGVIYKADTGFIQGTIIGNPPAAPSFTISGDSAYNYPGGILTITGNGTYTISMRNGVTSTTNEKIIVSSGVKANITLIDIHIDLRDINNAAAFDMTNAEVNLTLAGNNILRSGTYRAGIETPNNSILIITEASTGSLTAIGGSLAAGIGGGNRGDSGHDRDAGGYITISGGTITAISDSHGAGIGGSSHGEGGNINITGGIVNAIGGSGLPSGAGIGGSGIGSGGIINITGGTVTATGGGASWFGGSGLDSFGAAGIGGGNGGSGGIINISGNNTVITSTGGCGGAGIGGGGGDSDDNPFQIYSAGTISITGGTITTTGGNIARSSGIGSGSSSAAGTLNTINGNAVIFASSIQLALPSGGNLGPAIIFAGSNGTMYGNVTLTQNVTFPAGRVLPISAGQSLIIPNGITLTNNGTINNSGTINGASRIFGNAPVGGIINP